VAKKKTAKKAKKAGARGITFWLARDGSQRASSDVIDAYILFWGRPRKLDFVWDDPVSDPIGVFGAKHFEEHTDPSLHLEPGGGPIRVRLVREEEA